MNLNAILTPREQQIAGMISVGESKKIIADKLYISEHTVNTTGKHIYEKTGVQSIGQLATWWFVKKFNLSLNEVYSAALSLFFIFLVCVNEVNTKKTVLRVRSCRVKTVRSKTKSTEDLC